MTKRDIRNICFSRKNVDLKNCGYRHAKRKAEGKILERSKLLGGQGKAWGAQFRQGSESVGEFHMTVSIHKMSCHREDRA